MIESRKVGRRDSNNFKLGMLRYQGMADIKWCELWQHYKSKIVEMLIYSANCFSVIGRVEDPQNLCASNEARSSVILDPWIICSVIRGLLVCL